MAAAAPRPVVALKLPNKVKSIITYAQSIATSLTNNPSFTTPNPPIATLLADIQALSTAEAAGLSRTKGAVETRNAKLEVVRVDLDNLKTYVQSIAGAATPENAPAAIASAGMTARKVTLHDNCPRSERGLGLRDGESGREVCGSFGSVRVAVLVK
jgi:hypothetical protein